MILMAVAHLGVTERAAASTRVEFEPADNEIKVRIGGAHVTSYLFQNTLTKPSLYPIKTPSGVVLNRNFPLVKVEGETKDHPHHVGIFFTYDEVNGQGFWNNTKTPPQIKHVKTTATEAGADRGKLSTLSHWVAKDGETVVMEEARSMTFAALQDGYSIDFQIELTAKIKVEFGDTKEGMFAIRTADWLKEKGGTGKYLSSDGKQTSKEIWGRRAPWVALEGKNEDKAVGIVILNHPSSVNYPTFWHAREYGLFSANPLGQEAFEKANKVANPKALHLTLEPGQSAHFRFLVMVYDGTRTKDELEAQFQKYAK